MGWLSKKQTLIPSKFFGGSSPEYDEDPIALSDGTHWTCADSLIKYLLRKGELNQLPPAHRVHDEQEEQ